MNVPVLSPAPDKLRVPVWTFTDPVLLNPMPGPMDVVPVPMFLINVPAFANV